ncbi:MAG TPA: protein kinase [Pyrinomonadaceae bacterium]|nr:protein kinase [Pyrinomonadaceae bacterium]
MGNKNNDFLGTERFKIRRRLGSGGMGVVYEVHDRETDKVVALKALTRSEASHIARFKNEFRSLSDVSHPNLVALYEFMSDGENWFFTMELVDGVNFLEYVRPGYRARRSDSSISPTLLKPDSDEYKQTMQAIADYEAETQQLSVARTTYADDLPQEIKVETRLSQSRLDLDRLELAMRQLSEGLHALHQTGKLHRDIKPSNVLITKNGRVVILDFGLVAEVEPRGLHDTITLAGTPDYMSPEQGAQLPISTASDWYSVGVMLYQAVTGQLPFTGKFFEVMVNKQNWDPLPPSLLAPDVPRELNELCMGLLARDPQQRPSGHEVLRVLGHGKTGPLRHPLMPAGFSSSRSGAPFVGRQAQLQELFEGLDVTKRGQTVKVYVHGESGVGKTALVRNFLDRLRDRESSVVILEGRCYERESVPYKALDGVIDSLTRYLLDLPDTKVEALLPRDVVALARLFPVMLQVDAIFNAPQREHEAADPFNVRRRAFVALRELLGRIADRQPLVLYIDDLQWSDADSMSLLEEVLRPPDSPPLMLIASFRTEDVESKGFLKSLLNQTGSEKCREIRVTALTKEESRNLAQNLLGSNVPASGPIINSIIREARGNPFLLEQLAQYASTSEQAAETGISLGVMLVSRLRNLPKGTQQFIEALAVAGRPINAEVAYQAAGLSGDELPLVSSLRAAQFLRTGGEDHTIELYHDRIRETFTAQLAPGKVTHIHRRLAQALEARGIDDPEALFEHYMGAGERVRAATHAAIAAKKATGALAFDRAAAFYRRALELTPLRGAELIELKRGLAEALVNAGRPAEAAEAFLDVAQDTSATHSLDLKRRAAEQLLMGGHIKEGLEVIRSVLSSVGMTLPGGPKRALLSLIVKRIQLRLRGLKFTERSINEIPETDLMRIDICGAVAAGLGVVDIIRGADFQCRYLLLALQEGEPFRIARALAFQIGQIASRGPRTQKRLEQISQQTEALAQKLGDPHAIALSIWGRGVAAYLMGHWKNAAMLCERAAEIFRDQCTGVTWELTIANRFMLSSMLYMGEIGEISRRVPSLLSAALDQGNLFAADLRTRLNLIWLAADDPVRARAEVIEALQAWSHEGFHLQHYTSLQALVQIELYTGDYEVGWRHIHNQWKDLKNSMLMRIQIVRIDALHLLARATLAWAKESGDVEGHLRMAEKLAEDLLRERVAWAAPLAHLVSAAVAHQRGEKTKAMNLLSRAAEAFDLADMDLYEAVARRRLGELIAGDRRQRDMAGDRGQRDINEADAWMRKRQIENPEAMTRLLAPGFD